MAFGKELRRVRTVHVGLVSGPCGLRFEVRLRTEALRLEGVKTLKEHVELEPRELEIATQQGRTDLFHQKFIRGKRQIDEGSGRIVLKVGMDMRSTSLGTMTLRR